MGKKHNFNKKNAKGNPRPRNPNAWVDIVRENENLENYYKEQNIIDPSEWNSFITTCQADLPVTFRLTGSKKHAIEVRDSMEKNYFSELKGLQWEGESVPEPKPIAFYPDNLGWQVNVSKKVIRKNKPFARFQRFLVVENDVGNISRQEAVSMIPPLLLDVEPQHAVLDMCAAPGSKTAQLIEALHSGPENPTGFVMANDSDYKRSYMLIHQVKRLNSPNLIVTNHDAQMFPKIRLSSTSNEVLKFDRVLCDVPCSGDGTMRKNVNVWKDWTVGNGLGLHPTQVNILARGVQLLKHGGRLVYSTCSLNPIENEAVVAEVLRKYENSISLVDVSDRLPGLVRNVGISTWKVQTKDKVWRNAGDEGLARSLFPPDQEEADRFHLERTLRVYPHQQDTGGFYIAVFEKKPLEESKKRVADEVVADKQPVEKKAKVAEQTAKEESVPVESSVPTPTPLVPESDEKPTIIDGETVVEQVEEKIKKEKLPRDANEEPFKFVADNHPTVDTCWNFYGISPEFPRSSLVVRNDSGEPLRIIYYVAPVIRPIIENNTSLKIVHAGIKLFAQQKNEGDCKWRVQSEGIELLYPYVSESRVVEATGLETLKTLCQSSFPRFVELELIDNHLKQQVEKVSQGCLFLKVPRENGLDALIFPMWRGKTSVNIMLPKQDSQEVLHRYFGIENLKQAKEKPATETPEVETTTETA